MVQTFVVFADGPPTAKIKKRDSVIGLNNYVMCGRDTHVHAITSVIRVKHTAVS